MGDMDGFVVYLTVEESQFWKSFHHILQVPGEKQFTGARFFRESQVILIAELHIVITTYSL